MTALLHVFRHLSLEDRARAAVVSKEWHHVAQHPSLWETLDLRNRQDAGAWLSRLQFDSAEAARQLYRMHLRHVNLEFAAGVTDAGLLTLRGCALDSLNLNACQQVTNLALSALLATSPGIQRLSLYWNLNVTNDTLFTAAAQCPGLRALSLSGCKNVTDPGVRALARGCSGITALDLTRCVQVTDAGFEEVARGCRGVEELRLYACSGVTDRALAEIGTLSSLRVLDLTGAVLVTDEGARALAGCTELREAVLTWCIQLTDEGMVPLAEACHRLELLSLHGIQGVTDRTVEALAGSCRETLATLDLSGCSGVARRSHEELRAVLPRLRCFVVHS